MSFIRIRWLVPYIMFRMEEKPATIGPKINQVKRKSDKFCRVCCQTELEKGHSKNLCPNTKTLIEIENHKARLASFCLENK